MITFFLCALSVDSTSIEAEDEEGEATANSGLMAEEDAEADERDAEYQPSTRVIRQSSSSQDDSIHLSIPKRDLLKATSDVSARLKISHRQAVAFTASVVRAGGGSLEDVTLSKSSSHRHRIYDINKTYDNIVASFRDNMPEHIVLHWDAKQIKYAHRKETEERLAVVASLPGDERPAQFLGAPLLPDGSGASIRDGTKAALEEWTIPASHIVGLSWDTTSANTGAVKGSSTLLERELGGARLWLACRHHIGELHVKHVDREIRGATTGEFNGFIYLISSN